MLAAKQGNLQAMENLATVQDRLDYGEAAQSWRTLASQTQQQRAANKQRLFSSIAYALGCAAGGGLLSAGQWRSPAKIGTAAPAYHSAKIGTAAPVYHSAPGAGMPVVALVEGYLRKPKG